MKDLVIVQSKTVNNESVPVIIKEIDPETGEAEKREISRSVIFKDFQAEMSIKWAKSLINVNPNEFSIVDIKGDVSKRTQENVRVSQEKSKGFKCEYCGAEPKSKAGLTAHIRYNHPEKWEGKKPSPKKVEGKDKKSELLKEPINKTIKE